MFENRPLRRIFWPKRDEITGEWRKLGIEELNDLYWSLNIVRVIKSRRMRWLEHVACVGIIEVYAGFWWGNLTEKDHLEEPGLNGRIILRWIFRKWDMGNGLHRSDSGQVHVVGTCECRNELSGSIKRMEFLE